MFDFTRTLALVKGAILDPEPTWDRYLPDASDWKKTAVLLTGPLIVGSVVLDYLVDSIIPNRIAFIPGPSLTSMLLGLVMAAIAAFVVAFVFAILAGLLWRSSRPTAAIGPSINGCGNSCTSPDFKKTSTTQSNTTTAYIRSSKKN